MQTVSIRVNKKIVDKVKKSKIKTGVAVGKFFEISAAEKLSSLVKQSQQSKK